MMCPLAQFIAIKGMGAEQTRPCVVSTPLTMTLHDTSSAPASQTTMSRPLGAFPCCGQATMQRGQLNQERGQLNQEHCMRVVELSPKEQVDF